MNFEKVIDYTLLRADVTLSDVKRICQETLQHKFYAVCVPPVFVKDAFYALEENAKIVTVVGFPMGYSAVPAKVEEIKRAIDEEADEIDAVINIAAVKSANWNFVNNDIETIIRSVHLRGKVVKLIIETGLLTKDEIKRVCEIAEKNQVNYIRTSTGFNGKGADVETVSFLKSILLPETKIFAAGGIRTQKDAEALINAGASRFETSYALDFV